MAEPKEIGTVWTLGCEVFIEDALTAEVQEIKVNDIALSANIFTEGLSVEVGSDRVNAMDLDVRISMDGLKTYIIDSQIVPYEDVLKITDFSPEATNEKRYASSANTSKKIIDSVGELEGRVNLTEGDIDALGKRVDDLELKGTGGSGDGFWYLNEQDGKIHTDIGIVVHGDAIVEGDTSSGGEGEDVVVGIQGVRVNGTTHYDEDGDGVVDLGTIESGGGGLTSVSWGDIQGTPPSVSTFDNDVPYVDEGTFNLFSEDVNTAISEVSGDIEDLSSLLASMWHLDENGNLVTDKQVIIKNSLISEDDTSSGGEGQDTPGGSGGVSEEDVLNILEKNNYITSAALSSYYTKSQSDARYLALSGGMLYGSERGLLNLNSSDYLGPYITFSIEGTIKAYIGYDTHAGAFFETPNEHLFLRSSNAYFKAGSSEYTLIHSGNVGSQNAGSADVIATTYANQSIDIGAESRVRLVSLTASNSIELGAPMQYVSGLSVMSNYVGWQLVSGASSWDNDDFFIRKLADNGNYLDWRQLAFTDSNVASATKLATARTIWGHSFDGTNDVLAGNGVGIMSSKGNYYGLSILPTGSPFWGVRTFLTYDEGSTMGAYEIASRNTYGLTISHAGGAAYDFGNIPSNLSYTTLVNIGPNGNVGIGIISPSAKLHVDGQINISGGTYNNYSFIRSENYASNQSLLRIGVCYGYSVEATAITIRYGVTSVTGDLIVSGDVASA